MKKESFLYVLRKRLLLIVILVMMIGAAVWVSSYVQQQKKLNDNLHTDEPLVATGLKPVVFLTVSTEGNLGTILTETTPVGEDYLNDCMFVGDSITVGVQLYEQFGNVTTVARLGISTQSALTFSFHPVEGGKTLTMIEAIEYYRPRKVYIMLGTNGLNASTPEWNLNHYAIFIDEILNRVPGCYVVIQSIPPVTLKAAAAQPKLSKEFIDSYNAGLRQLAIDKGVYFLDIHAVFADANGNLREDVLGGGDGIHLNAFGYRLWHDYVLSHAIQGDSAFSIGKDGLIQFIRVQKEPAEPVPVEGGEPNPEDANPEEPLTEEPQTTDGETPSP